MLVGYLSNQFARADRTDLFVRIEQHRQFGVVAPAGLAENLQRMQDHCDAALVVGDARPVDAVAIDAIGLGGEDAALIDGIHMGDQHQLFAAAAFERPDHDIGPGAARRLAPLGLGSQRFQPRLGEVGHFGEAFDVGAARFDHHHVA